jgi:hypothetical protein
MIVALGNTRRPLFGKPSNAIHKGDNSMNKIVLRSTSLIFASVLAVGIFTSGRATSQNAVLMPNKLINLAFFYKPPSNSDAATVSGNFSNVILTGGDESFRDQLIGAGFASTIPQYYRADGIQNPGSCTASPAHNQIAYKVGDFCSISQNHPDWFLLDTSGNRMPTSPGSSYYRMDPGNAGWRSFFVSRLLEIDQQKGWSGVFLDNVEASLAEIQNDGLMPAKYPDHASYQAAVSGFLQYLNQNYAQPYNRPVMANIIARSDEAQWFNYMPYLTGAMQERWAVPWASTTGYISESKWSSDMVLAEKTQAQGWFILLVAQGDKADTARQNFAFASYLLISNGYASFRYTNSSMYREVWLYENYKVQLGSPLGGRYQVGTAWRRDFTNGYVTVDPVNHTANISVSPTASPTSTKVPTLAMTNTPTTMPTLAVTNSPTSLPTMTTVNTATSVPATATSTATTLPTNTATSVPSTVVYDDKNAAFVYSSGWSDVTNTAAYSGEFKLTQTVGSSITLGFTGQKFSIFYKSGSRFGKVDIYIDGKLITTLDQKTSKEIYQNKWSYSGTLTASAHTLKLVFASPPNGRISLDAVSIP